MLILARRVGASTSGGAVHAYDLPDGESVPPLWRAVCGAQLAAVEAEQVAPFTGVPCPVCLMKAAGDEVRAGEAQSALPSEGVPATCPNVPITSNGSYAAGLRGRELHRVEPGAVRGRLDGRDVVQTSCGHLGWGPLSGGSVPPEWPLCAECARGQS